MSPRLLLWVPLFAACTLVLGLVFALVAPFDASAGARRGLIVSWARLTLWLAGIAVEVEGRENLPEGPAVYAANHASALDIPILFAALPVDFRIIHKRSLYLVPVIGWCLYLGQHIPIDRSQPFRARRSLEAAARRIRGGTSVVVFPEGTRSRDGSVGLFKRGSFVLAANAEVPVVPVALVGVKALVPSGLLSLRPGRLRVSVRPPLPTTSSLPAEAERLAARVRAEVMAVVAPDARP